MTRQRWAPALSLALLPPGLLPVILMLGGVLAGCGGARVPSSEPVPRASTAPAPPPAPRSPASLEPTARLRPAAPTWHVGDQWAFRWESADGSGEYVWTVDRLERIGGVEHYVIRSGPREIYFRIADLATALETREGRVERRNLPPRVGFSWPLSAGTSWRQRFLEESEVQTAGERAIDWTVESEDDVRVEGGTFKTLRIVARHSQTPDLVYEMWYAPAVKQWVRLKEYFPAGVRFRELTDFNLR